MHIIIITVVVVVITAYRFPLKTTDPTLNTYRRRGRPVFICAAAASKRLCTHIILCMYIVFLEHAHNILHKTRIFLNVSFLRSRPKRPLKDILYRANNN